LPRRSVRDLIIELDRAIGTLVTSPIFKSGKIVDSRALVKTQLDLEMIVRLSDRLSRMEGVSN